jgi:site-specific recombinase XerD
MKFAFYEYKPGRFQVYFTYQGEQVHLTRNLAYDEPLKSKKDCQALIKYLHEHGFDPERFGIKQKAFRFDLAVETWKKLSTCSPEWLEQRKQISSRFFLPFFKQRDIRTIKTNHILEFLSFLKSKGLKDKSIYNYMGELRSFFRFHKKLLNEVPEFPKITVQEKPIKWLTEEEQDKVFQHISQQDLPIFEFMRRYGTRTNEASGLLKPNVFLDSDPAYFVITSVLGATGQLKPYTKTKRIKILPILPELKWIFENGNGSQFVFAKQWRGEWRPYTNRMLNLIWNRANKASGIAPINLYNAMRHSFGCQRLNEGFSLDEIRRVYSHTTSKTTERYAAYQLQTLEDIIRGRGYKKVILPQDIQTSENIVINKLGGKDSNLG